MILCCCYGVLFLFFLPLPQRLPFLLNKLQGFLSTQSFECSLCTRSVLLGLTCNFERAFSATGFWIFCLTYYGYCLLVESFSLMEISEQIKHKIHGLLKLFFILENNIQESEFGNQSPSTSGQRKFIYLLSESKLGGPYLF